MPFKQFLDQNANGNYTDGKKKPCIAKILITENICSG